MGGISAHGIGVGTRQSLRSLPTQAILWFYDSLKVCRKPWFFLHSWRVRIFCEHPVIRGRYKSASSLALGNLSSTENSHGWWKLLDSQSPRKDTSRLSYSENNLSDVTDASDRSCSHSPCWAATDTNRSDHESPPLYHNLYSSHFPLLCYLPQFLLLVRACTGW